MSRIEERIIVDKPEGPSPYQMQKVVMMTPADVARLAEIQKNPQIAERKFSVVQARSEGPNPISVLAEKGRPINLSKNEIDNMLFTLLLSLSTENMEEMGSTIADDYFTGGPDPLIRY